MNNKPEHSMGKVMFHCMSGNRCKIIDILYSYRYKEFRYVVSFGELNSTTLLHDEFQEDNPNLY